MGGGVTAAAVGSISVPGAAYFFAAEVRRNHPLMDCLRFEDRGSAGQGTQPCGSVKNRASFMVPSPVVSHDMFAVIGKRPAPWIFVYR